MNPSDVAQSFVEACESSGSSFDLLAGAFRKAVGELGFRYFALSSHVDPLNPPPHAIVLFNYPAAWIRRFSAAKFYAIDPVFEHAERTLYPFFWDAAFQHARISERQRVVLSEAAAFGLAHGYTIPINLPWIPLPLRASCSVVPDSVVIDKGRYLAVQVIARYFHFSICASRIPLPSTVGAELTNRERECLTLAAAGMNDREIANQLGLAGTTVHSHIGNSMFRFGAHRRIQAIMLAVIRGEISIGDLAVKLETSRKHPARDRGRSSASRHRQDRMPQKTQSEKGDRCKYP
jgi:LuxR family transcriptional regulator, quorum-sensing system regulator CciR